MNTTASRRLPRPPHLTRAPLLVLHVVAFTAASYGLLGRTRSSSWWITRWSPSHSAYSAQAYRMTRVA